MFNDRTKEEKDAHEFYITGSGVTDPPKDVFSINKSTGEVTVHKSIDRETDPIFHVRNPPEQHINDIILEPVLQVRMHGGIYLVWGTPPYREDSREL